MMRQKEDATSIQSHNTGNKTMSQKAVQKDRKHHFTEIINRD